MGTLTRRMALAAVLSLGLVGMIPGVAFAAQPSCGDTITTNVTLTANLDCSAVADHGLTFGDDGLVLNLNGYTITGWTGDDDWNGVSTDGYDHVVVKNGTIRNFETNLYVSYSSSGKFKNLTLIGEAAEPSGSGVYMDYGAGNVLDNVDTSGSVSEGMYFYYNASTQLLNSNVEGGGYGLYVEGDSVDLIRGNNFHAVNGDGVYDTSSGHQKYVANKSSNNSGGYGFYLDCDGYGRITLLNNRANNNQDDGFYLYYCYDDLSYNNGSLISGNTANGNGGSGFYDEYSTSSTWTYNTAKNNGDDGFNFYYASNDVIKWNFAKGNGDSGFEISENYQTGYYNAKAFSYNTATYNNYGHYAAYPIPGKGNVAHHNSVDNCYLVNCVAP